MRSEGYLILDDILKSIGVDVTNIDTVLDSDKITVYETSNLTFSFNYNDIEYYCKFGTIDSPYNELVACELLKDFKLPSLEYDLAQVAGMKGVFSSDFRFKDRNYISAHDLLYSDDRIEDRTNLEDIWNALLERYKSNPNCSEIVSYLMKRIVDLFIFDIFIANNDRCETNFQIVEGEDFYDIAPIYDNERMLDNKKIPMFAIGVFSNIDNSGPYDVLTQFLRYSDNSYLDKIKDRLWIIEEENINKTFEKIEKKTNYPMNPILKNYYLDKFAVHRGKIEEIINEYERKK